MIRSGTILVGLVFCACISFAQVASSPSVHNHQTGPTGPPAIDGSVHPELIPDSLAYRLYFVALSTPQNPTQAEQDRQHAHVMKTGLAESDQQIFVAILSDFRSKYDALTAQYNESARAASAHNGTTDVHVLLKSLDDLVQSTRDAIGVRLTSRGAARVHSFVLSEKKNMKVQLED